jgi:hypothetical protein
MDFHLWKHNQNLYQTDCYTANNYDKNSRFDLQQIEKYLKLCIENHLNFPNVARSPHGRRLLTKRQKDQRKRNGSHFGLFPSPYPRF